MQFAFYLLNIIYFIAAHAIIMKLHLSEGSSSWLHSRFKKIQKTDESLSNHTHFKNGCYRECCSLKYANGMPITGNLFFWSHPVIAIMQYSIKWWGLQETQMYPIMFFSIFFILHVRKLCEISIIYCENKNTCHIIVPYFYSTLLTIRSIYHFFFFKIMHLYHKYLIQSIRMRCVATVSK